MATEAQLQAAIAALQTATAKLDATNNYALNVHRALADIASKNGTVTFDTPEGAKTLKTLQQMQQDLEASVAFEGDITKQGATAKAILQYHDASGGPEGYIHIKTPMNASQFRGMFLFAVEGMDWGAAKVIDEKFSGYANSKAPSTTRFSAKGDNQPHVYHAADGAITLRFHLGGHNYTTFTLTSMLVGNGKLWTKADADNFQVILSNSETI